jgi:hypothetical protein
VIGAVCVIGRKSFDYTPAQKKYVLLSYGAMENERVPTFRLPGKLGGKVEDYDTVSEQRTELIALN